jgi:hypothetical protein
MRDRDPEGRPRNARPRDGLGRPLPYGSAGGVPRVADDYAPTAAEAVAVTGRHLDAGRPFHAHEVLEARWKCGPAAERDLWQGLAQLCVGLTHLQRGNRKGAVTLLTRGADRVAGWAAAGGAPTAYGMDIARAVTFARALAGLAAGDAVDPVTAVAGLRACFPSDDPGDVPDPPPADRAAGRPAD